MRHTVLFSLFLFLTACSASRIAEGLKQGQAGPEAFDARINFEGDQAGIYAQASIQGVSANVILDSGSPSILSKTLADQLGLKPKLRGKVTDRYGNTKKLGFVQIDSIVLEGVEFRNTWAFVDDLQDNPEMACQNIEAVLGANLMRLTHWQIDFRNQKLRMRPNTRALEIGKQTIELDFQTTAAGTPLLELQMDKGQTVVFQLDTGDEGGLWLTEQQPTGESVQALGIDLKSRYNPVPDSLTLGLISGVKMKDQELPASIARFSSEGSARAGAAWLSKFRMQIDWDAQKIWLTPYPQMPPDKLAGFGFEPHFVDGTLRVGLLYTNGPAQRAGVELNDRILFMNGIDCINITADSYCRLLSTNQLAQWNSLDLTVEQQQTTKKYSLQKEVLLAAPSAN